VVQVLVVGPVGVDDVRAGTAEQIEQLGVDGSTGAVNRVSGISENEYSATPRVAPAARHSSTRSPARPVVRQRARTVAPLSAYQRMRMPIPISASFV
jgi:hypothetical protein